MTKEPQILIDSKIIERYVLGTDEDRNVIDKLYGHLLSELKDKLFNSMLADTCKKNFSSARGQFNQGCYQVFYKEKRYNLFSPFYGNFIPVFGVSFKHDHLLLSKFFTGAIQYTPGIIVDILLVRKFCCVADKLINKRKTFLKSL